jgi:uncharacterized protein YaeQ
MALPSKLYRFKIELSDLEKGSYESLDFRVAQHPSESLSYLLTRVLAYALSFEQGLEFSSEGLHNPDDPTLAVKNPMGGIKIWIEIGNPSARRLHKASKAADIVKVYTYKDPQVLLNEINSEEVYRKDDLEIFSIPTSFLDQLEKNIHKENRWSVINNDGVLMINGESFDLQCEIKRHGASAPN